MLPAAPSLTGTFSKVTQHGSQLKATFLKKWLKRFWLPLYPQMGTLVRTLDVIVFTLITGSVIGLAFDGEVTVGVNYDPMRDEMFEATRGHGAYLNGRTLEVSKKSSIGDCVLGMDLSYNDQGVINGIDVIRSIWPDMQTLRIMGSSALGIAYAASGRTDLYFHHQLEPWDQVAGILLVEEAGGIITDRGGKRAGLYSDGLIASNHTLHAEFMRKTEGLAWSQRNQLSPHATADDPPE